MLNIDSNDKDDTRLRILKVALDLFSKYGFDAVSTRRIAHEAACNIASLNYHFGTKKKLYNECILKMEPKTDHQLDLALKTPSTRDEFEAGFLRFCTIVSQFVVVNSSSLKLLINEINSNTNFEVQDPFLKPLTERFEAYLKEAQKNKIINGNIHASLLTRMVVAVIVSQNLYKSFKTFEIISDEDLAKKIVESCTTNFYV